MIQSMDPTYKKLVGLLAVGAALRPDEESREDYLLLKIFSSSYMQNPLKVLLNSRHQNALMDELREGETLTQFLMLFESRLLANYTNHLPVVEVFQHKTNHVLSLYIEVHSQ